MFDSSRMPRRQIDLAIVLLARLLTVKSLTRLSSVCILGITGPAGLATDFLFRLLPAVSWWSTRNISSGALQCGAYYRILVEDDEGF